MSDLKAKPAIFLTSLLLSLGGVALAQEDATDSVSLPAFSDVDTNGDAMISLDEFRNVDTGYATHEETFASLDENGDGSLSQEEWADNDDENMMDDDATDQ